MLKKIILVIGALIIALASTLAVSPLFTDDGDTDDRERLSISSQSLTEVYSGTALRGDKWTLTSGTLAPGHTLKVSVTGERVNVGKSNNSFTATVVNSDGVDVSDSYLIEKNEGTLEVLPRPITVKAHDRSKVFDGEPLLPGGYSITRGEIVAGHTVTPTYTGERTVAGSSVCTVALAISDENGNDVSINYSVEAKDGTLTVGKRVLHLRSRSLEAFYDGSHHRDETVVIADGSLPQSCVMKAEFTEGLVNAGTVDNRFIVAISDLDGNSMLDSFEIQYVYGRITVLPRSVTISTADAYKNYDGLELRAESYDFITGELAFGDSISAVFTASRTEAGSTANTATFSFLNSKGEIVDANYNVNVIYGNLTVARTGLVFVSEDAQKSYDGEPLSYNSVRLASGTLPVGYSFTYQCVGEITDIGTAENLFTVEIFDENSLEVTQDFEITYINGSLTVTRREIIVASASDSKIYDGEELQCDGYTLTGELADGDVIEVLPSATITDVGTVPNEIIIKISRDGEDVTDNYDIECVWGTLTVTGRYLYIVSASDSWVFDGNEHSRCAPEDLTLITGSLIDGHRLVPVGFDKTITNVGEIENEFFITVLDAEDNDVTKNYTVEKEYGRLTVVPLDIVFVSADVSKEYDGEVLEATQGRPLDPTLLTGYTYVSEGVGSLINVGEIENDFTVRIIGADGEDISENFNIIKNTGKLTVLPRAIEVVSEGATKTYDGEELTNDTVEIVFGELVTGHVPFITATGSITDAGESPNTFIFDILDGEGESVKSNYDVIITEGMLTVLPAPLTVVSATQDMTYTGEELFCHEADIALGELFLDHELSLTFYNSRVTVGSVENGYLLDIVNGEGESVIDNYEVEAIFGTLSVVPREMIFSTASATAVYSGEELILNEYTLENPDILLDGHTYTVSFSEYARITDVGTVDNSIAYVTVLDAQGSDISENYSFTALCGRLIIVPRAITVRTKSAVKEYDGTPLRREEWEIVSLTGLCDGHTIDVAVSGERTSVGVSDNTVSEVRITDAGLNNVTYNYEIILQLGELIVTGDPIGSGEGSESGGESEGIDDSGEIGGEETSGEPILYMYSEVGERVYLRYASFGDYNGHGFDTATPYGKTLPGGYSYNGLVSLSLAGSGRVSHKVSIRNLASTQYFLPYFTENAELNYKIQSSDTVNSILGDSEYSLFMYSYTGDGSDLVGYLSDYEQEELDYREFVNNNYLYLDDETKNEVLAILADAEIYPDGSDLISRVADYLKKTFAYDALYDTALDGEGNVILSFLKDYKAGVCTHFASSAVAMYRALGIPARYTVGLTALTDAGAYTEFTGRNSHAWAEVYVNGVGWIPVEVTPAAATAPGAFDGFTVVPETVTMKYDGVTTLYPSGAVRGLSELVARGYTYTATVSGSRKNVGISQSIIESLTIRDPEGYDVTDEFKIKLLSGKIHVYAEEITVSTESASAVYNGAPLTAPTADITEGELMHGHIAGELIATGVQSGVGRSENGISVIILDSEGRDVTEYYKINKSLGTLEVTPREITLTASSAEKSYDGTALTDSGYTLSGELCEGDTLTVTVVGSQTNVGRSDNVIKTALVLDRAGNDVTANYRISCQSGVLTVKYPEN